MLALQSEAGRIERNRGAELVRRCLFDSAAFDRHQGQPAALRETDRGDAIGIDRWIAAPESSGPGRRPRPNRSGAAVRRCFEAARTKAVHRERHIAPGRDPLAPAFIEPPPVAIAAMQQHDRGRGARIVRLASGNPAADADWQAGFRFRPRSPDEIEPQGTCGRASGQERGEEGGDLGEASSRATSQRSRRRWPSIIYPKSSARWPSAPSAGFPRGCRALQNPPASGPA